ncbi:MAG TPA: beta-eliminating lyase-related protein [Kineosporiaceae bacterium]
MRQVGVLAAAGAHALEHHLGRLVDGHRRAAHLAKAVAAARPDVLDPGEVETDIVVIDLTRAPLTGPELAAAARERGVLGSVLGPLRPWHDRQVGDGRMGG